MKLRWCFLMLSVPLLLKPSSSYAWRTHCKLAGLAVCKFCNPRSFASHQAFHRRAHRRAMRSLKKGRCCSRQGWQRSRRQYFISGSYRKNYVWRKDFYSSGSTRYLYCKNRRAATKLYNKNFSCGRSSYSRTVGYWRNRRP